VHNRVFNHVGVSVTNIEDFVAFYQKVLGFQLVGPIVHVKQSEMPDAGIFAIYPESLKEVKVAFLVTGNGVGYEVFEFIQPKGLPQTQEESFSQGYHRSGFFHICVTDPDPEKLADEVEKNGGRRIGPTTDPIRAGMKCLYTADPWGNVVEILSVSFEHLVVAQAYRS
jgi:catechol 2,3-dioxygenase-like lactoylglutathione lyase family enzyme